MIGTPELAWNAIEAYYTRKQETRCKDMYFNRNARESFIQAFNKKYDEIMDQYMDSSVESLDRHKQAAILIYCTINCNVFSPNRALENDEIFIGEQQVALLLGLSFMKDRLNELLKKGNQRTIEKYALPEAFSCSTKYFDILTRDLYFQSHKEDSVYILFLAHVLFLIEYISLKENHIDDTVLREWPSNE